MTASRQKMLYTRVGNDPVLLAVMAEINRSAVKPPKGYLTRDQWAAKWKLKSGHTASIYLAQALKIGVLVKARYRILIGDSGRLRTVDHYGPPLSKRKAP
jgi:Fic family protein